MPVIALKLHNKEPSPSRKTRLALTDVMVAADTGDCGISVEPAKPIRTAAHPKIMVPEGPFLREPQQRLRHPHNKDPRKDLSLENCPSLDLNCFLHPQNEGMRSENMIKSNLYTFKFH